MYKRIVAVILAAFLMVGVPVQTYAAPKKLSRVEIAREVICGDWGSGDKRVAALKKAGYDPDQVQGDVNTLLCCRENIIQGIRAMAKTIADNNNWWYIYWTGKYGHECAICHPHGGDNHGWQCIGYAAACWHHGGLPTTCYCGTVANEEWEYILNAKTDAAALKKAQSCLGIKDIKVIRNKNGIPKSQAKPGDMAAIFHGSEFYHTFIVMSDSKIADATTQTPKVNNIRADRNFGGGYVSDLKVIIRYTGNGLCSPPKRTTDQLAYEVIEGLWGSGDSRVTALKQAGHDYDAVQKRVNEILNPPKPTPDTKPTAIFKDFVETPAKIGQACANEKGSLGGGKAGDQTGNEVCISKYTYGSSGSPYHWEYLFRAKNQTARLKIADACKKACKNDHIGYDTDSSDRKSLYKEAKKAGWKIDAITTDCETTCSELANVCIATAGLKHIGTDTQANVDTLRKKLQSSAEFVSVPVKMENLQPGDILISDSHTAVVTGSAIRKGESSKRVLDLQRWFNANGYKLDEDGGFGVATESAVKDYQKKHGLTADGIVGTDSIKVMKADSPTPAKKYTGKLPTMVLKKTNGQVIADTIEWVKWIANDNNFHYGKGSAAHHNGCYFCDTQPASKKSLNGWKKTYCCNPFVGAAWAHGGCVPTAHNLCLKGKSWDFGTGGGSYHTCSLFTYLGKPAEKNLKAGDVLCNSHHVALYIGGGKVAEAGAEDDNVKNSKKWNSSIRITGLNYGSFQRVYRYNSSVNCTYAICPGEVSDRVKDMQNLLRWKGYNITADREYGDATIKVVKDYQTKKGLTADGIAGPATLKAMEVDAA